MTDINIEIAKEITPELITALQTLIHQLSPTLKVPTEEDLKSIINSENIKLFLAKNGDKQIIGMVTLTAQHTPSGIHTHIEDLIVDTGARGRGVGQKLLKTAVEVARKINATYIDLTSRPHRIDAHALYERVGFIKRDTNVYRFHTSQEVANLGINLKKVTVIGGGTGTFVVLSGLKKYPLNLGVIVTMMDSGGSTGKLRDQLGVLPPGDLRQALVALSDAPLLWRKLFLYRFEQGDLAGHNFGNIFLSALEKVSQNYDEVISTVSYVLKTKGNVFPVTYEKTHMCVEYENGKILKGEANIDKNYQETTKVKEAFLEPSAKANPKAIKQLQQTDYIILGPGDLYSSIIPVLLVDEIKKTIMNSKAKIIYNVNLMTKAGQTPNYKASDHVHDLEKFLGRSLDYIVINNTELPADIVDWYKSQQEKPVENDLIPGNLRSKIVNADIVDNRRFTKSNADKLVNPRVRSILRHDSEKLGNILKQLI